jgi:hypothetical protein
MIKKLIIGVVLLLLVAVGGTVYYLDSLVQRGIEVVGTQVLGTQVTVSGVSLSPLSGQGSISGLTIANPEGFDSAYAFELGEISLALDIASLSTDVVEISSIVIDSPRITYETNLRNDNIRALLRNVSGEGSADEPVDDTSNPGKDLLIREFRMLNPQLDVVTQIASAPIAMPDIVINDIGTGENGVSAEELLRLVLGRVNRAIVEGNFPSVEQLRDQIEGNFRERVEDTVEDLGNRIRDIFN